MTRSLLRFAGMESVFQRQRRHAHRRRRKPLALAVQSLEPRLALAVGVAGGFEKAATPPADTAPPAIRSITAPKGQTYGEGGRIAFRVHFTEPVLVTGTPELPIVVGTTVRQAAWNGKGSGGKSLTFMVDVQSGDLAPAGVQVAGPITFPNGATISDRAGNDLNPAASGAFPKVRVDAVGPSVSDFGPIAVAGRRVSMLVTFTERVTVRGKPSLPFTLAGAPRQFVYGRGSGSSVLVFQYKATKTETPTVGDVAVSNPAITFGSGRIVDGAGNVPASVAQPTDITLSATTIAENAGANAVVGTFTTTDPDAGSTFTYTLVSGVGDTDNASFSIAGGQLRATTSFDFETKGSYSVLVRCTDQGGLSFEKPFTITVTDLAVEMAFVTVGDLGNQADGTGYGAVNYQYQIGTYEVTIGQYTSFLNAVAKSDPYSLYHASMRSNLKIAGIARAGDSGSYTYSVVNNGGDSSNRPITFVSWFDAARFANWMHNGQGSGSTETGAYTISTGVITGASRTNNVNTYTLSAPSTLSVGDQVWVDGLSGLGFSRIGVVTSVSDSQFTMTYTGPDATATGSGSFTGASPTALAGALYRLPTENEWYKAAYYKGGGTNAGYWAYATQSDTAPGNTIGGGVNQANCYAGDYAVTQSSSLSPSQNYLTNVGAFTNSGSYYGTFDQSGNVYEWTEVIVSGSLNSYRGVRGGYWSNDPTNLSSSASRGADDPSYGGSIGNGFRLARPV